MAAIRGEFIDEETMIPAARWRLVHGLFASPEEQIENVKRWNRERGWGFTDGDFAALGRPPEWPKERLIAVVLVPQFSDSVRTFRELWEVAASRQKNAWCDPRILAKPSNFSTKLIAFPFFRLYWEVIDLGANWDKEKGIAPAEVRTPLSLGPLAAAAHNPHWIRVADGLKTPRIYLSSSLRVTVKDEREAGAHVVCLGYDQGYREIMLSLDFADGRDRRYGHPTVLSRAA